MNNGEAKWYCIWRLNGDGTKASSSPLYNSIVRKEAEARLKELELNFPESRYVLEELQIFHG